MSRQLTDDESWIVAHNLPLVDTCLRVYRGFDSATFCDLRAAGYMGLCRAITLFDPKAGPWPQYACRWIKCFLQREVKFLASPVHVPEHQRYNKPEKVQRAKREKSRAKAEYALSRAAAILGGSRVQWDNHEAAAAIAPAPHQDGPDYEDVHRAMLALPEQSREILTRIVMRGEPRSVVAADMGISKRQLSDLRTNAAKRLRELLTPHED